MRRRTRLIAGTFAFVAMTFSLAETVIASTCAPGAGMAMAEAVDTHAPEHDCVTASHDREHRGSGEDGRHCPFSPATAAQGCAAVASLPASAMTDFSPSLEGAGTVFVEPSEHDLLLAQPPFHPPRA